MMARSPAGGQSKVKVNVCLQRETRCLCAAVHLVLQLVAGCSPYSLVRMVLRCPGHYSYLPENLSSILIYSPSLKVCMSRCWLGASGPPWPRFEPGPGWAIGFADSSTIHFITVSPVFSFFYMQNYCGKDSSLTNGRHSPCYFHHVCIIICTK